MLRNGVIGLAFVLLILTGCDSASGDDNELTGGVLVTFDVQAEQFRVWITNPATIEQLFDLRDGRSAASIPNGPLLRGSGVGNHNTPWSWHLDPEETAMAEVTIEVCSGIPSFIENDLDQWVDVVGQYCPWSAELAKLEDFR